MLTLSESFDDRDWLLSIIEAKLDELVRHERFMLRIQSIHLINKMQEHVGNEFINARIIEDLLRLLNDPVPNIRFNVSKTIALLAAKLTPQNKERVIQALEKVFETDKDFDAKFFAEKTLCQMTGREPTLQAQQQDAQNQNV